MTSEAEESASVIAAQPESIRLALSSAWDEHHHVRDQTWKVLHMEVLLVAGMIGVNYQISSLPVTLAIGFLVIAATMFGAQITIRHRNNVEVLKFQMIGSFEKALGLLPLIGKVLPLPEEIGFLDAFRITKNNTALFILRMHLAMMLFTFLFLVGRCIGR